MKWTELPMFRSVSSRMNAARSMRSTYGRTPRPQPQHVEVPRVVDLRARDGQLEGRIVTEGVVVLGDDGAAAVLVARELAQLPDPERRLAVGHIVFEARHD